MSQKYYAYLLLENNISGICETWEECKIITSKTKSRYKSFKTITLAKQWLKNGALYEVKKKKLLNTKLEKGIYFDAGTGRNIGVEVRVVDENKNNLIEKIVPKNKINEFGNYNLGFDKTNNFGELLGIFVALKIALKNSKHNFIFGDSKLVIEFWSKGRYNKTLPDDTIDLIKKVSNLRIKFETNNGIIKHISGDINPADLGFHK